MIAFLAPLLTIQVSRLLRSSNWRRSQGACHCPHLQPPADCRPVYSGAPLPPRHSIFDPIEFYPMVSRRIVPLRSIVCPSAIPRLVISVVVNAVNAQLGRALAHILEKLPRIVPPLADDNASAPVAIPPFGFFVVTPVHHMRPRLEPCLIGGPMRSKPLGRAHRRNLFPQASARLRAGIQTMRLNFYARSAVAKRTPHHIFTRVLQPLPDGQAAHSRPLIIDEFHYVPSA